MKAALALISMTVLGATATAHASGRGVIRDLPPMKSVRAGHTLTTLRNGSAIVVGGFMSEEDQIAGAELFDPALKQFIAIDNLTTPRQSHTATLLPDGRVLIAGGYSAFGMTVDTAELFDPATRRFSLAGSMRASRAEHSAVLLSDGRVALIGGIGTDRTGLDSVEFYDPKTNTFSAAGRMTVARMANISVLLGDGRIFVYCGYERHGSNGERYATAEIFDPRSGRSNSTPNTLSRYSPDAVVLADGRILITGGADERGARGKYDSTEIFDPAKNTFKPAAKMNMARYKHRGSSLLLPNGKVIIAGGAAQPELYDPATDSFTLLESESRLHGSFSAVALLDNHRALIAGGYFRPTSPSNGAWLYEF